MRSLLTVAVFAAGLLGLLSAGVTGHPAQDKKKDQPKAKADPLANKPDEATLKQIAAKTEQLRKAIGAIKDNPNSPDAEICLRAAENIVNFDEWYAADAGKKTLQVLDMGLDRAAKLARGAMPWRKTTGQWVVLGFRSAVDDTAQPCAVLYPPGYDENKKYRLDIILHGRDATLTEAKFIAANEGKAGPKDLDHIELQVFGRGNNAYRWAGETDVFEARGVVNQYYNFHRVVLRGFSMGGAGTWHIGLHHPDQFCAIGPGAGFTTTRGYVGNLPAKLPDYQERCLHIYDAVDYAENVFNVPVVAYSGEIDPQKKAADNIENALKGFKETFKFTHLVAPGLEHKMPPEWMAKADAEYRKYTETAREAMPNRTRFVTYTERYNKCDWATNIGLETPYSKATIDVVRKDDGLTIATQNIRHFWVWVHALPKGCRSVVVDGQKLDLDAPYLLDASVVPLLVKANGQWKPETFTTLNDKMKRVKGGPIDDAFRYGFLIVPPSGAGWYPIPNAHFASDMKRFGNEWERYFRGQIQSTTSAAYDPTTRREHMSKSLVLFGDPQSNPLIAKVLPKLPITWTKDELVVNGVKYDPKTHVPVLIYPNPLGGGYVVLNSGHTFKEADLKGTNALLYPRLGDWAVIKPTPTEKDPTAYEVAAAGIFDSNWQFEKK